MNANSWVDWSSSTPFAWLTAAITLGIAGLAFVMSTSGCGDDECGYAFVVTGQEECDSLVDLLNCDTSTLNGTLCSLEDCDCNSFGTTCDLVVTVANEMQCTSQATQRQCADSSFSEMSCALTDCNCGCSYVFTAADADDCRNLGAGFGCIGNQFSEGSCSLCDCFVCVGPATNPGVCQPTS